MADHELPQMPERAADVSRNAFGACARGPRGEDGWEVTPGRERWELGMGDAALELQGDAPPSLPDTGPSSSSTDIRRRVRGRNVEAVGVELVFEEAEPLVGGMASESRAERVKEEQHRTRCRRGQASTWHPVTAAFWSC
jgi:hypothetical protein